MPRFVDPSNGNVSFISAAALANPAASGIDLDNMSAVYVDAEGNCWRSDGTKLYGLSVNAIDNFNFLNQAEIVSAKFGRRRHGLWWGSMNAQWQTTFGGYTWRLALCVPKPAKAIRVGFPQNPSGAWTVDGLAVGSTGVGGSRDVSAGGAFVVGTFDNGTSLTKTIPQWNPQPVGYQALCPGALVWSDWIPSPTVERTDIVGAPPITLISVYSASTNTATVNSVGGDLPWQNEPLPRWDGFKAGNQLTASGFGTNNPQTIPIQSVEWTTADYGLSVGSFGDSIEEGNKTGQRGRGWVITTAAALTTATGSSVSSVMSGFPGDTQANFLNRFYAMASAGNLPDICIFRVWTRNSAGLSVGQNQANCDAFIRLCLQYNVLPALEAAIAETALPSNNTLSAAANAGALVLCEQYGIPYIDMRAAINDANAATYLDADGIHPNNAGNILMGDTAAVALLPYARALLSLQ